MQDEILISSLGGDLQFLQDNCEAVTEKVFEMAARHGHIQILDWGIKNNLVSCKYQLYYEAAEGDQLQTLQWLFEEKVMAYDDMIRWHSIRAAAEHGSFKVLGWLLETNTKGSSWLFYGALDGKRIDVLEWCFSKQIKIDNYASIAERAAEKGELWFLQWLEVHGYDWKSVTVCARAALEGHLTILKWARQCDCPWDGQTTENAAKFGSLEIIKWCLDNGCPLGKYAMEYATAKGHLAILKWFYTSEFPMDLRALYARTTPKSKDIKEWMLSILRKQ